MRRKEKEESVGKMSSKNSDTIMKKQSNGKGYECTLCGKIMMNKSVANRHAQNIHYQPRSVQCQVCQKTYKTQAGLANHCVTAHNSSIASCPSENCAFTTHVFRR